jgi:hypothetical protein
MMTDKEKLILDLVQGQMNSLKILGENQSKDLNDIRKNGYGDIHPSNQESVITGLSYTHGYTVGYNVLAEKILELLGMTDGEIVELNEKNERIVEENKNYRKMITDRIINKYK